MRYDVAVQAKTKNTKYRGLAFKQKGSRKSDREIVKKMRKREG